MTRILAIDTSSAACSAALFDNGAIRSRYEIAPRRHAQLILPMIESLLQEAGIEARRLDACAFGRGPGSFTGLRIAASVVQGLAFAAGVPVVPVSSLAALARGGMRSGNHRQVLAALDARKDEVYYGAYVQDEQDGVRLAGSEQVCAPDKVRLPGTLDWAGIGSGWQAYAEQLQAAAGGRICTVMSGREPHAEDVAWLAQFGLAQGLAVAPEQAVPVYLRDNVADVRKT